jgi:hypothetical protein
MKTFKKPNLAYYLAVAGFLLICVRLSASPQNVMISKPEEKSPLRFRVIAVEPRVCAKGHIELELELRNIGEKQIFIDPKGVFYQISVTSDTGGRTVTADPGSNPSLRQYVALKENDSYRTTMTYQLDDAFFSVEGVYRLRLAYGQFAQTSSAPPDLYRGGIISNEILFEVRSCRDDHP